MDELSNPLDQEIVLKPGEITQLEMKLGVWQVVERYPDPRMILLNKWNIGRKSLVSARK